MTAIPRENLADRLADRYAGGHRRHDLAVRPGEECLAEVHGGVSAQAQELELRHEESRVRVGIRVREDLALHLRVGLGNRVNLGDDEIRLIERYHEQARAGAVTHIGVTAHPGEVELIVQDHIADFAVAAALDENHLAAELPLPSVERRSALTVRLDRHARTANPPQEPPCTRVA